jgi:hypothetical protein
MSDRDKEKVHLWVDGDRKAEWTKYVESTTEVESLTQLVRNAVSTYINSGGLDGRRSDGQPSSQEVSVDNSEVIEGINRLESQMGDLDDRLLSLSNMAERSPELSDVMMKVFEVLPPQEPHTDEWSQEKNFLTAPEDQDSIAWDGQPSTIADMIDVEEFWVDMALDKLGTDSERVKGRSDASGVTHHWKDMGYGDGRYNQVRDSEGEQ